MREREIAGLLRDKHPAGMPQLLLHYGTLRIWEKADRFAPPARQLEGMAHRRHAEHGL